MGLFSKSLSCEEVGTVIAEHCRTSLRDVPRDNEARLREFVALGISSSRLGVLFSSLPRDKQERIATAFDKALDQKLDLASFGALLNRRGERYFRMFNEHIDEFNVGNWRPFSEELSFQFGQFCAGGGEDDTPLIIGSLSDQASNLAFGVEANNLFAKSFGGSRDLIAKHNPA